MTCSFCRQTETSVRHTALCVFRLSCLNDVPESEIGYHIYLGDKAGVGLPGHQ